DRAAAALELARIGRGTEVHDPAVAKLGLEPGAGAAAHLGNAREIVNLGTINRPRGKIAAGEKHQRVAVETQSIAAVVIDRALASVRRVLRAATPYARKAAHCPAPAGEPIARTTAVCQRQFRRHTGRAGWQCQGKLVHRVTAGGDRELSGSVADQRGGIN